MAVVSLSLGVWCGKMIGGNGLGGALSGGQT